MNRVLSFMLAMLFLGVFSGDLCHAEDSPTFVVNGTVMGYDKAIVRIKTETGVLLVPRSAVPDIKDLLLGKSKVSAKMRPEEFMRLNAPSGRHLEIESINPTVKK